MSNALIPEIIQKGTSTIKITRQGAVIEGELPPSTVEETIKKLGKAKSACQFAIGDLTNYLKGKKGKELAEIAARTGLSADDLARQSNTCARIPYDQREAQLDFDFHVLAASAEGEKQPREWLVLTSEQSLSREALRELTAVRVIEQESPAVALPSPESSSAAVVTSPSDHGGTEGNDASSTKPTTDTGTRTLVSAINRLATDAVKQSQSLDGLPVERLFDLHHDLLPVLRLWAKITKRFKGKLSPEMQDEFQADLMALMEALGAGDESVFEVE